MTAPTGSGGVLAVLGAAVSDLQCRRYGDDHTHIDECNRLTDAEDAALATVEAMAEALELARDGLIVAAGQEHPAFLGFVLTVDKANAALARFHGTTPPAGGGDDDLARIGELIRTQDNRITAEPIFIVQQKRGGDDDLARIGELIRTQDNRITAEPIFIVQQKRGGDGAEPADPWRPINELPNSDDLFWFLSWGPDGGHVVDGPRSPQTGGYDADEWEYFAPCQSPSIRRLASSGGA